MRRWVWRVLLAALVLAALTGSALAADPVTLDNGIVLEQDGAGYKVTGYTGGGGRVVISAEYDSKPISSIAASAFKTTNGRRVTEVVFPNTITEVGSNAFENCVNLKTVIFMPESTGDVTIRKSAFSGTGISTLVLPDKLVTIGESAFANNRSLTKVTIPDTVTEIESKAFANNVKLKTVYIPEAIKPTTPGTSKPISADAFANTTLESIHYGGKDKADVLYNIFEALPTGMWREQVHLATDSTHVNPPTCVDDGLVMGGGFCREASGNQTDACKDLAGEGDGTPIAALGHDQQKPLDEFEKEAANHADCATWEWTYTAPCSRCGETVNGSETILPKEGATHAWVNDGPGEITTPPTCTSKGVRTIPQKCEPTGGKLCDATRTITEDVNPEPHTYKDKTLVYEIRPATCSEDPNKQGLTAVYKRCENCDTPNFCATECEKFQKALEEARKGTDEAVIAAAETDLIGHLRTEHDNNTPDKFVKLVELDRLDHTKPEPVEGDSGNVESITPATCTEDGKIVYKAGTKCTECGEELTDDDLKGTIPLLGHDYVALGNDDKDNYEKRPTCTEDGVKRTSPEKCTRCGDIKAAKTEPVYALGHLWGDFVPDEGQDATPNETCVEKKVTGTVTCTVCGEEVERTLTIEGLGAHNYKGSEWVVVKEATATEDGLKERPCMNPGCTHKDPQVIPATGTPSEPDEPTDPDKPTTPEEKTYKVDVVQASNGTTSVSRSTAKEGDLVTITVTPNSGYVLDMIRVIGDSRVLSLTDLGGGRYRFTMPASNVEVRVTYDRTGSDYGSNWTEGFGNSGSGDRSDPRRTSDVVPVQIQEPAVGEAGASEQIFLDIPATHWAAGEINWASQMGYMNGSGGRFNPGGNISQQQMWMVLARLSGEQPASMEEARRWAERGGYADGSAPTAPVKRHQLVKALYRCARLTGRAARTSASLAGYPDSRAVPAVARDAFTWALSGGIVSSDAEGRLNPNQIVTRDQFAVILYRYSYRL